MKSRAAAGEPIYVRKSFPGSPALPVPNNPMFRRRDIEFRRQGTYRITSNDVIALSDHPRPPVPQPWWPDGHPG